MQLPSQSSGTATEFDSNDFPALSGDSQRGLSLPPPGALSYASLGGQPSGPQSAVGATLPSSRELSADDFPALGGPAAPALHHQPSINGLPSAPQRPLQLQQEQAAAAALAHKQGLLGSLSSGQQPSPTLRTYGLEDQRRVGLYFLSTNQHSHIYIQLQTHPPNGLQQHSLRSPSSTLGPRSHLPAAKSNAPYPGSVTPSNATTTNHTGLPLTNGSAAAVTPHPDNSLLDPHANSTAMPQTPAQQVLFSPADRFGLVGLLHLIKTGDPDLTMLSLGSDLSKLGLDMGRKECVLLSSCVWVLPILTTLASPLQQLVIYIGHTMGRRRIVSSHSAPTRVPFANVLHRQPTKRLHQAGTSHRRNPLLHLLLPTTR